QDVDLYGAKLADGDRLTHVIGPRRGVWVQMIRGMIKANGEVIVAGDGMALIREPDITMTAHEDAEFLLFDMAL
ncbi:MAG: pirin family protein, partial [Pseudomonadota bacterium]